MGVSAIGAARQAPRCRLSRPSRRETLRPCSGLVPAQGFRLADRCCYGDSRRQNVNSCQRRASIQRSQHRPVCERLRLLISQQRLSGLFLPLPILFPTSRYPPLPLFSLLVRWWMVCWVLFQFRHCPCPCCTSPRDLDHDHYLHRTTPFVLSIGSVRQAEK